MYRAARIVRRPLATLTLAAVVPLALSPISGCGQNPYSDLIECAVPGGDDCGGTDSDTDSGTTAGSNSTSNSGNSNSNGSTGNGGSEGSQSGSESEGWPEPVSCDGPPNCTADDGGGDLGPVTAPFFRGQVCLPSSARSGDKIPVRVTTCVHPCLTVNAFKYKHMYRCDVDNDPVCESAVLVRHPDISGQGCPDDVFGMFDASYCEDFGPIDLAIGPIDLGDSAYEGDLSVLIPFLTNADAGSMEAGNDAASEVWPVIESYEQTSDRRFTVSLSAGAPATPADCSGEGACTCHDVAL